MITRIELNDLNGTEEVQKVVSDALDAYKVEVSEVNTIEELQEMETELMGVHDTFGAELKERMYNLPTSATFDGEEYKKSKIAENIIYFLNKQEVEWSYTLGLYQAVKFWKNVEDTIPYEVYDSTLRLLNQVKFKGTSEWEKILAINEFMASCHSEYVKDATYLIYLSQMHNCLMDRAKLLQPMPVESSAHEVEA